jgi:hypothetical protein
MESIAFGHQGGDAVGYRRAPRTEVCHRQSQGIDQRVHVEQSLDLRAAQNKHASQPPDAGHTASDRTTKASTAATHCPGYDTPLLVSQFMRARLTTSAAPARIS